MSAVVSEICTLVHTDLVHTAVVSETRTLVHVISIDIK